MEILFSIPYEEVAEYKGITVEQVILDIKNGVVDPDSLYSFMSYCLREK
jgi:hypothetical protein